MTLPSKKAELRSKMAEIRPLVKAHKGWRKRVFEKFPQYNTVDGYRRLSNVLSGDSTDELITTFLENLVK